MMLGLFVGKLVIYHSIIKFHDNLISAFLLISAGNSNQPISNKDGSENVNEDILRKIIQKWN